MRIVSWNVNGLRAVWGRKDLEWALGEQSDADVVCLQETKIQEADITHSMRNPKGWRTFWSVSAARKGYSGTAVFVREGIQCERVALAVGGKDHPEYDIEGRVVAVEFPIGARALTLLNVYFPNGGMSDERLAFKHAWHDAFLAKITERARESSLVVVGDFNVAHKEIDVAMPEKWSSQTGFLPEERAWFQKMLDAGFVDSFRAEKGDLQRQFTFWETRVDARRENIGWRIDYAVLSADLEEKMRDAWISPQILGSDHCPVGVDLDLEVNAHKNEEWALADAPEEQLEDEDVGWRRR